MLFENCNLKVHRQMCFCRTLFCLNVSNSCIFMSYVRKVVKDVSSQEPRSNGISFLQPHLLSYSDETFLRAFRMGVSSQQNAFSTQELTVFENNIQVRRRCLPFVVSSLPKFMLRLDLYCYSFYMYLI